MTRPPTLCFEHIGVFVFWMSFLAAQLNWRSFYQTRKRRKFSRCERQSYNNTLCNHRHQHQHHHHLIHRHHNACVCECMFVPVNGAHQIMNFDINRIQCIYYVEGKELYDAHKSHTKCIFSSSVKS